MGHIHLIIGPVGAGKSTFALHLRRERRAVSLNLDDWMAALFGKDERPAVGVLDWYVERRDRCLEQIWKVTESVLGVGTEVVLEVGLIQRRERHAFYDRVDTGGHPLTVYLLDAPRELRWERVEGRNQEKRETFSMEVPRHIFELASDMWEPPEEEECRGREIRSVLDVTGTDGRLRWLYDDQR